MKSSKGPWVKCRRAKRAGLGGAVAAGVVILMSVLPGRVGAAQDRLPAQNQQDQPIKLKTTLVQVPVIVSEGGRYVTDLKQSDFELREDGAPQTIELFKSIDEPFTVALLLDCSGSTMDQLGQIKRAAEAFVDNLRPVDRVMVISFDDSVHIQCEFTGDRGVLRRAIEAISPGEYTQVYEAVYTAVWERLRNVQGRKAAIVFTDGIDTASSEIDQDDTLDAVEDVEDVLVYPIRYSTRADVERRLAARTNAPRSNTSGGHEMSPQEQSEALDRTYRTADEYLEQLAESSGGVVERADTLNDLEGAFRKIAEELRQQYLLGYYPSNEKASDQQRRISVRVFRQGVSVRARPGYHVSEQ